MATPSTDHGRPAEAEKILTSLDAVAPMSMTSCPGWTAHHVAAHIAGSYQEIRYHLEAFASGRPLQKTRSFEEREPPLYALPYGELLAQAEREEVSMRQVLAEVLDQAPDARLQWTGRTVDAAGFGTHMRSEDAVHRWDLVGDDEASAALLGQQELLDHAVGFIGAPLCQRGLRQGAGDRPLTVIVRTEGQDDLKVTMGEGTARLAVVPADGSATIHADGAARLLLLWGRKPSPFYRLQAVGNTRDVSQLQLLFSGY